ncbi:MAG: NYN domain-containing protein [Dehalococcoidia bacterium]|nr:NYN domain-containing protein [Dehalococcoidia bacterium]
MFLFVTMTTYVYIDGFNLHTGAVKDTPFKWLNLSEMCRRLLPSHQIALIRYFTARVIGFDHDPQTPARQDVFLRALRTLPNLEVHADGWFARRIQRLPQYPLVYLPEGQKPPVRPPQLVQVLRFEEKRTDVDIVTRLLMDCFLDRFDDAVVISNDEDLALPIQMVRNEFKKRIGVINPHNRDEVSSGLKAAASYSFRTINRKILAESQFPLVLTDAQCPFQKPSSW